jgi:Smg protein
MEWPSGPKHRVRRARALHSGMRYSCLMFDVLVYLYEHYWRPDACPESELLVRKLSAVGFEEDEISEALVWLDGLQTVTQHPVLVPSAGSSRVYSDVELDRLGTEALGFLQFLESAGVLSAALREVVLDRVLAVPRGPVDLDDFKILVLLVFWSMGEEPDALILDELFVDDEDRLIH